ncbi:uncharacterized protein LOC123313748 [Coccinella septempunctata]|uniref:uncharacterized protein LOC123313748 n=1 Tax=Coccinella septempunctata TaxID=41139 RepID=UPI001D081C92|nr:uncharacterized protein LOC123313748 [Coccinella septempunctata]
MSEKKDDEFYKYNHTIGLVTNASYLIQNLALLNTEDYYKADCLAVAHEGHINYIPLVNTLRRCKYVPICGGCDRGKGLIKWMKWVKMNNDTYFICLSTIGIQFFDLELTDVQFEFDFKELNGRLSLPLGACVLEDTLFVGTAMGIIVMFKSTDECVKMINHLQVSNFLYLDGANDCLVTVSREEMKTYRLVDGKLNLISSLKEILLLYSVLKIFNDNLFIGHHTGELSLMSFSNLNIIIKQKLHDGEITAIDYSINKQILLTASEDLLLRAWKLDKTQRKVGGSH